MSVPQVLYEAKLATEGRKLSRAGLAVLALWIAGGLGFCFGFDSFPGNFPALVIVVLGAVVLSIPTLRVMKWRKHAGCYRISIDDHGLYVQSDDPAFAPSFSVIAPDLGRLVRKTTKSSEGGDEVEYFVETKSGNRLPIGWLFADYDLDVMELFDQITDRFRWVEIIEEVER